MTSFSIGYAELLASRLSILNYKMKRRGGEKLPLNRIKKIMQANREIGKIQTGTPQLIAWALEAFLEDLTTKSAALCQQN